MQPLTELPQDPLVEVIPSLAEDPGALRLPLPILLRVPLFPLNKLEAKHAAEFVPPNSISKSLIAPDAGKSLGLAAPKKGFRFLIMLVAAIALTAIALAPTVAIHWNARLNLPEDPASDIIDLPEEPTAMAQSSVPADPKRPAENKPGSKPAARTAPFAQGRSASLGAEIIPLDNGDTP